MLVLGAETAIVIDGIAVVKLVRGRGGKAKFVVTAPRAVQVLRVTLPDGCRLAGEIADRVAAERVDSTSAQRVA